MRTCRDNDVDSRKKKVSSGVRKPPEIKWQKGKINSNCKHSQGINLNVPVLRDKSEGLPVGGIEHETPPVFTASALTARPDSLSAVDEGGEVNRLKYLTQDFPPLGHVTAGRARSIRGT
jgi:hypothetical protein